MQGLVLKKKADYDGAEALYRRALAIVLRTFDRSHYKYGMISNNLADCYRKRGQYPQANSSSVSVCCFVVTLSIQALSIYEEALAALSSSLGAQHAETAEV